METDANEKTTTNIKLTVYADGKEKFSERYVLPGFRDEYNRLYDEAVEDDFIPTVIVLKEDGLWLCDDLEFLLDRMQGCEKIDRTVWPDGLESFWLGLEQNPPKVGDTVTYENGGLKIVAVGDCNPMTDCKVMDIE